MSAADRLDRSDPTIAQIRRVPGVVVLRVMMDDGGTRDVPIPKAGNRWSRVAGVLERLVWVRMDLLDKDGGILGVVERQAEEEEEDDGDGGAVEDMMPVSVVKLFAKLITDTQADTMKQVAAMFAAQLSGMSEMVSAMTEGQRAISDSYTLAMRVQTAHAVSDAAGGDGDKVMQMIQMAMAMARPAPPSPSPQKQVAAPPKKKEG